MDWRALFWSIALPAFALVILYFATSTKNARTTIATLRPDGEVIAFSKPLVVQVIFDEPTEAHPPVLADLVINYKNLIQGKYMVAASNLPTEDASTPLNLSPATDEIPTPSESSLPENFQLIEDHINLNF
jgi:hypothetical protein